MLPAEPATPAPEIPPPKPAAPVPVEERIQAIDVLRGLALFGILTANMRGFNSPMQAYFNPLLMWKEPADRIAQALVDCFVSGKFITLFAFLFGLGFAVQLTRAETGGGRFAGLFGRRMTGLLLFGLAHSFLIWWGDILLNYAFVGFLLLLFRKRSQKTVLIWATALYWVPVVAMAGLAVAVMLGAKVPSPPEPTAQILQETIRVYAEGSYGEVFGKRAAEWRALNSAFPFFFPRVLSLFLFGFWFWRTGFFQNLAEHVPTVRRAAPWLLLAGAAGNGAATAINEIWRPNPMGADPMAVLYFLVASAAIPALSAFYACLVILAVGDERWRRRVSVFGYVGRMALTNYLLQSVLCTTLYYSHGFGLYGKVGPLMGVLPTILIYGAQILFSGWWLGQFRYGPCEWLWRAMTYGRNVTRRAQAACVS